MPSDWLQHVDLLKEDIMHTTEKQLISGFGGMHIRLLIGGNRGKPTAHFDLQLTINVMHELALAELSCLGNWGLLLHASLRKHMRWLGMETIYVTALLHVKDCKPPKRILLPEFSHIYSHTVQKKIYLTKGKQFKHRQIYLRLLIMRLLWNKNKNTKPVSKY